MPAVQRLTRWSGRGWDERFFFCSSKVTAEREESGEREKLQSLTAWNKSYRLELDEGEERGDDRGCQWPPAAEQWHWWNKAGSREQCFCQASLAARPTTRADRYCSCFKWSFSYHQIYTNYTMQSSISNVNQRLIHGLHLMFKLCFSSLAEIPVFGLLFVWFGFFFQGNDKQSLLFRTTKKNTTSNDLWPGTLVTSKVPSY